MKLPCAKILLILSLLKLCRNGCLLRWKICQFAPVCLWSWFGMSTKELMRLSIILIFCLSFIRLFCGCIIIGVRGIEKTNQIILRGI